jgi:hypothetical protein
MVDASKLYWKNAEGSGLASDNIFLGTEGIIVPSGTTVQRPSSPVNGTFRYNTDTHNVEVYQNNSWTPSSGTLTGTANQISIGVVGITTTIGIVDNPVIPGVLGMVVPVGGHGDETELGAINGMIRYDTTVNQFRGRINGVWQNITDNYFLNPLTTRGDMLRAAVGGTPSRLPLGAPNTFMISNGTDPIWGSPTVLDGVVIGGVTPAVATVTTFTATGSATLGSGSNNYFRFDGAGSTPVINAVGGDANIGINFVSKGIGEFAFWTGDGKQVAIINTALVTRYITLTGSNGGNPTIGTSAGSLAITPATVFANALTVSSGGAAITGNSSVTGTLGVSGTTSIGTASAHYINIAGSGGSPTIDATDAGAVARNLILNPSGGTVYTQQGLNVGLGQTNQLTLNGNATNPTIGTSGGELQLSGTNRVIASAASFSGLAITNSSAGGQP